MCIMKPMRFLRIRLNKRLTKATVADDVHDAFCKCKFLRIRVSRNLFHATDLLRELKLLHVHLLSSKSIQSAEASDSNGPTWRNAKMPLEWGGKSNLVLFFPWYAKDNRRRWSKEDEGKALTLLIIFSFCHDDYSNTKPGKSKFNSWC